MDSETPRRRVTDKLAADSAPAQTAQVIEYIFRKRYDYGLPELDALLGGLGSGELTVGGGGPGMGKTSFAVKRALHWARQGLRVLYVLGEMKPTDMLQKLVATDMNVEWEAIRYNLLVGDQKVERERLWQWYHDHVLTKLHFADKSKFGAITPDLIAKWARSGQYDIIIVDYLTTVLPGGQATETEQIVETMQKLEAAAEESDTAILLLSQINRAALHEDSLGKAPSLALLQGSSKIEQKAWTVFFLMKAYDIVGREVGKTRAGLPIIKPVAEEAKGCIAVWCAKHRVKGWASLGVQARVRFWRGHYGEAAVQEAIAAHHAREEADNRRFSRELQQGRSASAAAPGDPMAGHKAILVQVRAQRQEAA